MPKKLLAIVDDWEKLEVYETRLASRFEVHCAPFGSTGLEMAREQAPDLLLIDLIFEDMHEDEACAQLDREPALARIPRVVITDGASGGTPVADSPSHERRMIRPYEFTDLERALEDIGI